MDRMTLFSGITLDGPTTRDIDDAFELTFEDGRWRLLVSIANVARAIGVDSDLDLKARERTATRYYGAGNSPMFPRWYSENTLSLWPDKPKKVMAVELTFDETGLRLGKKIHRKALLQSRAKLSYEMVPAILTQEGHEHYQLFQGARRLAFALLDRRRKSGAMVLYDLNNGWITTEEGHLKKIEKHEETVGQIIIQEFMIAANVAVAEWCVENDVPVLYRNHRAQAAAPAREDLMQQMADAFATPVQDLDVVRQRVHMLMARAEYGPTLWGHYGLNVPAYLHFTSPIRRYADLVNQRQINAHLKGVPLPYTADHLLELATHINTVEKEERDRRSADLKDRHEQKAIQVGEDVRRLHGLKSKDFERVLKVQTRSGNAPTAALVEAFRARLDDRTIPPICLAVAYTFPPLNDDWQPLREDILAYLAKQPFDAVTLITQASQISGWPSPTHEVSQEGPSHAPLFMSKSSLQFTENVKEGPMPQGAQVTVKALSSKEARARACVLLLATVYGIEPPKFNPLKATAAPPPPPTKKKAFVVNPDKDPISVLYEYCQALGVPQPEYSFTSNGPSHQPTFVCICKVNGREGTGRSGSKQEAKRASIKAVLASL